MKLPPKTPVRFNNGFTLIEILVVLLILVASASIIPAYFSRGISSAELKNSIQKIRAGLRTTRALAISRKKSQSLQIDLSQKQITPPGKPAFQLPDSLEMKLTTAEDEVNSDNTGSIRFFPDGSSTGGTITLISDASQYQIGVDWISGKVTIQHDE